MSIFGGGTSLSTLLGNALAQSVNNALYNNLVARGATVGQITAFYDEILASEGIQEVINDATAIELNRSKLVASTVSRNGKLLVAARNWVNPWRITISPRPVYPWQEYRQKFEQITGDRLTTYVVQLGKTATWITEFQGYAAEFVTNGYTVASVNGAVLTLNLGSANTGIANGTVLFKAGDLIQPVGHYYPYVIVKDVVKTAASTVTLTLHRGYIPQTGYTVTGATIYVGANCTWRVKITKMPTTRLIPGRLAEFTDEFELTEYVE